MTKTVYRLEGGKAKLKRLSQENHPRKPAINDRARIQTLAHLLKHNTPYPTYIDIHMYTHRNISMATSTLLFFYAPVY